MGGRKLLHGTYFRLSHKYSSSSLFFARFSTCEHSTTSRSIMRPWILPPSHIFHRYRGV